MPWGSQAPPAPAAPKAPAPPKAAAAPAVESPFGGFGGGLFDKLKAMAEPKDVGGGSKPKVQVWTSSWSPPAFGND